MRKVVFIAINFIFFISNAQINQPNVGAVGESSLTLNPETYSHAMWQGPQINNNDRLAYAAVNSKGQWMYVNKEELVKGTPLVLENNRELTIYTKDKKVYKIENGNYNSNEDKLVTEYKKDSIYMFGDSNINYAKLDNILLKKMNNIETNKSRFHFLLSQGEKITFTKSYQGEILKGSVNVLTKLKETNDRYYIKEDYFYSKDNYNVQEIKLKKKQILDIMSDFKKEIVSYVKKNNLSYKEEKDVIKIMKYYNSL
ncbi:hypothetical protein CLV86_2312 [Lacinutrix venerupis]|uniref:hypothetical protein n=1 Tax=Lacinutrix venerupis TaxID=1486034 RepID=UPI000EB3F5FA|nr:hypothetical protein [Lacinutrix venerupis]RLJ61919.1 hypothetical protein CLV86_2312 [Lacinutrix venerupis]